MKIIFTCKCGEKNLRDDGIWICLKCGKKYDPIIGAPYISRYKPGFKEHYPTIDEGDQLEAELPDKEPILKMKRPHVAVR